MATTLKELALGRAEQYKLDPRIIQIEPGYNFRGFDSVNDDDDRDLKESIRENGVRTPITVGIIGDVVYVRAGHRRLSAVKELIAEGHGIVSIPAVAENRYATAADRDADLFISNQYKAMTGLQKAGLFRRMIDVHGWSEEQVRKMAGFKDVKQVQNLLLLTSVSPEVKQMIEENVVSPTQVIQTIKAEGDNATTVLTEARKVANAAGKDKITAATMKKAPDVTNPTSFATPSVLASLGATSPTPEVEAARAPRMVRTDAKFQEFHDTLREILNVDDVNSIHCMVRDVLHVGKAKVA